jgi:hypothetical protein
VFELIHETSSFVVLGNILHYGDWVNKVDKISMYFNSKNLDRDVLTKLLDTNKVEEMTYVPEFVRSGIIYSPDQDGVLGCEVEQASIDTRKIPTNVSQLYKLSALFVVDHKDGCLENLLDEINSCCVLIYMGENIDQVVSLNKFRFVSSSKPCSLESLEGNSTLIDCKLTIKGMSKEQSDEYLAQLCRLNKRGLMT